MDWSVNSLSSIRRVTNCFQGEGSFLGYSSQHRHVPGVSARAPDRLDKGTMIGDDALIDPSAGDLTDIDVRRVLCDRSMWE
jgi:hypothetical protein